MPVLATTAETIPPAIESWVTEKIPELVGSYDHATIGKTEGLPDVVVELERTMVAQNDPRFPYSQLQQVWVDIYELVADIMVDNTDDAAAALFLRRCSDRLKVQARADTTLGGRVQFTSPAVEADFVPQFVEYADGTQGRRMAVRLVVGNLVEVD